MSLARLVAVSCVLTTGLACAAPPRLTAAPADLADHPDLRDRERISVLVFGDSGHHASFPAVARAAADLCARREHPCDLAVLLGDNVYETGFTQPGGARWRRSFAAPMRPFVPAARDRKFRAWVTAGNHDWNHSLQGARRISAAIATTRSAANRRLAGLWQFPALAYEVPGLPRWLHLHAIDTQVIVKEKDPGVLATTQADMLRAGKDGWHVAFGHHAPVTTGSHGKFDPADARTLSAALERLRPAGLNLVLVGHDHHQELLESAGIPVVIQGNSSKAREVHDTEFTDCSRARRGGDALGFLIATFEPNQVTLEFFDERGAPAELRSPQGAPRPPGPIQLPRPDASAGDRPFGTCTPRPQTGAN